jgi:hypothetical protein
MERSARVLLLPIEDDEVHHAEHEEEREDAAQPDERQHDHVKRGQVGERRGGELAAELDRGHDLLVEQSVVRA